MEPERSWSRSHCLKVYSSRAGASGWMLDSSGAGAYAFLQWLPSPASDHGQRQALVEPLSLPGAAWNVNKFLCETAQEGGSGLAIHTSGFDCNWLKVIIVKKVIVFLAFFGLSISCYTAWYSGTDYVVTFCEGVHNCCVPYKAPASVPGVQGQTIGPSILSGQQAQGQRGDQCGSMIVWGWSLWLNVWGSGPFS